jgi:hypothetical protein
MATNQENIALDQVQDITLDQYSSPIFNPALQEQIGITKGYNYLDAPSNLDRIQLELIDQYDNTVESKEFHISEIDGIKYSGGRLQVDTFAILTQVFERTTGQFNIRVSGFRKYIYNDLANPDPSSSEEAITPSDVAPSAIIFASLEVVEVSRTRTEVRVKSNNTAFAAFEEFYQTQHVNRVPDTSPLLPNGQTSDTDIWPATLRIPKLDGSSLDLVTTNWIHHEYVPGTEGAVEGDVEAIDTIIFKLARPAPSNIRSGTRLQVLRPLFISYNIPVEIDIPYIVDELFNDLRGPNFRIDVSTKSSKSTTIKSEEDLVGTTTGIKNRIEKGVVSGSGLITTNCDYRQYKNFVHFSSAEERLKNFKYKLVQVEHYESKSAALSTGFGGSDGSVTGSQTILANKLKYDNLANGFISSFNPYEQYLYYTSHSAETVYTSEGVETLSPATWPKSTTTQTGTGYNLFSTTSSEATSWYAGQLVSASLWDQQNPSALRNVIPTHIRVDSEQSSYQLFFDMIGEHFDEVYLQIKSLEESHARDESVDVGLSKDLLFDIAKSFGWNLHPGHSTSELWEYVLGTDSDGVYQSSGSGETLTHVVKESHSSEDIEKQTWKRILNNLPLLLKTKGTARGVKSLLSAYGVPLTILNIDEYGGAPSSRAADTRAIEKFTYGINMSGSTTITTRHAHFKQHTPPNNSQGSANSLTTFGSNYRTPSMYEVRVDTSVQQTQQIARSSAGAGAGPVWEVRMEHSSSAEGWDTAASITAGSASAYAQYGRFTFEISSSAGQPAISASTAYLPIYDNDWWNVSFGVTEHPYKDQGSPGAPESQSFVIRCAKAAEHSQGSITHQSSGTVMGASQSYSAAWSTSGTAYWGNSNTSTPEAESFSGSLQEIRAWAEYLSDDAFHQHTLAPTSVVGDSVQMGYNDLLIRLPLGTDNKTYDHSTIATVTSSLPNTANLKFGVSGVGEGGHFTGFTDNPYSPKSETYFVKVPHTAGPSKHSNKIRIEDNTLKGNQLSRDSSFEISSFDSNPIDSEDVSVVLSPADQIDTDISMQFGGFDLDDYIGDPRDKYSPEYTSLRNMKTLYFKKYSEGNSVMAFVRFLRSFNKGLFNQIENMIPARADAVVGIEIRPNILERHKLTQPLSASRETMYYTGSLSIRTSGDMIASVPSSETFNSSEYGTHVAQIGIGAPPSRQRSGSNDYYNLYEGSKYLRDVFGEVTESATQQIVYNSRNATSSPISSRIQIPTYNKLSKPVYGVTATGSGWITVFEDNFTSFASHSDTYGAEPGHIYGPPDMSNTWRILSNYDAPSIVGDGLEVGNNTGNDQLWMQWNNPMSLQQNTLYRMSITVSASADTDSDNILYSGFSMFSTEDQLPEHMINIAIKTGNAEYSSAAYFVASGHNLSQNPGLGIDVTYQGYASSQQNNHGYYVADESTRNSATKAGMHKIITPLGGPVSKGAHIGKRLTHFTPLLLVNYSDDNGITRITHMKIEALPGAFVDVAPQYDSSPAQRRLLIDGSKMTSPDWNIGSTATIDGGPVAEFQLVNPNIVEVALGPDSAPIGGQPNINPLNQASNQNITVR